MFLVMFSFVGVCSCLSLLTSVTININMHLGNICNKISMKLILALTKHEKIYFSLVLLGILNSYQRIFIL